MSLAIARRRLGNQHIACPVFDSPAEVVAWLGAVQAQDYYGGLWAVGLRTRHATERAVEQALAGKTIVRTWPMRGTLHFVPPAGARWMLKLMASRVIAASAGRLLRQFGIDDDTLKQSRRVIVSSLEGGRQLTRSALYQALEAGHVSTARQRGLHIAWRLAQEGLICFGPRQGKQPTFVLLDEWLPLARPPERDEALAELTRRYFTGHGPATVQDFVWWSGLTAADARAGLDMAGSALVHEEVDGRIYWLTQDAAPAPESPPVAHLLPPYDEYLVAYRDRTAAFAAADARRPDYVRLMGGGTIAMDGRIVGSWKRTIEKGSVRITPSPFSPLTPPQHDALITATDRYAAFIERPLGLPIGNDSVTEESQRE